MENATPDFAWLFVKMVAGLFLVLILAVFLIRVLLPRLSGKKGLWGRSKPLGEWATVLDRLTLEPKKHLYLIQVAKRHFLIGSSENSLNLIAELPDFTGEKK